MENEATKDWYITEGTDTTAEKIYPVSQSFGAMFLGGPLVGAYLMAENYKVLGQPGKARITWLVTIVFTVLFFSLLEWRMPSGPHYVSIGIPMFYCYLGSMLMRKYQGEQLKDYVANGGSTYKWTRTFWVSLVCLTLMLLVVFVAAVLWALITDAKH